MSVDRRRRVGSECQSYVRLSVLTGIQRVIRETHGHLLDVLAVHDIDLVPVGTRDPGLDGSESRLPYLRSDPVAAQPMLPLADVDAVLLLDLNVGIDFPAIHRLRRQRRLPMVGMIHDLMPLHNPEWWPVGAATHFRVYVQQLVSIADHIVVPTPKVRDDLAALPWKIPARVHVIPLGSAFLPRCPSVPRDQRISMLYVSTIEPRKGHDVLLSAFDILRAEGVDVNLTLVGREGWESDHVFARIRSHPDFEGRLKWIRAADDLTIRVIAQDCTIGVVPAKDEGFGLFLEEALSLGLKVVASRTRVFLDRAQLNLSFSGPSPREWADAIVAAHAEPWHQARPAKVRTMADFADDIADLLVDVVQ